MTSFLSEIRFKRAGEWIAALIGAVNCILVPAMFAPSQSSLFPFPGLYFVQLVLIGLGVLAFVVARPNVKPRWLALPWVAAGLVLAFVVLGGFSIGPFLIPAFLAFVATGVLVDLQTGGPIGRHLGYLLLAAVAQAALMALMILL